MLASASKGRRDLLEKSAISHHVMVSGVAEEQFEQPDAQQMVNSLALAKAKAVASKLMMEEEGNCIYKEINSVLGCDSVFLFQNEVLGKPKNSSEAIERWKKMSSNFGFLITGHALLFDSEPEKTIDIKKFEFNSLIQGAITTRIEFLDLSISEIENYVATGEPFNCAGGFALEGKGGRLISKIDGCYSNVIGLSLPWLRSALIRAGLWKEFIV